MLKRVLLFVCIMAVGWPSVAQKVKLNHMTTFDDKLLHFGFSLGMNTLDFRVRNVSGISGISNSGVQTLSGEEASPDGSQELKADVAELIPGFTVGMVSNLRLNRDLDLRFLPGMSFGERKLQYNSEVKDKFLTYNKTMYNYSIKSTFLDFPLLIKYKALRINNGRPYVVFGSAYRVDISKSGKQDLVSLKRGGFYGEIGAGWDQYLPFFRFSVEAKFSFGLTDQLGKPPSPEQYQNYFKAIKSLHSNIFTLLFHFE